LRNSLSEPILRLREPPQKNLELSTGEEPRVEGSYACPANVANSNHSVSFEAEDRLLDQREGRTEETLQLSWVALLQQAERQ
jgi:hypothetical protein